MQIKDYLEKITKLQDYFLNFIVNNCNEEENEANLVNIFIDQNIKFNKYDLKLFLYIISQISNYHYRYPLFFQKIEQILKLIKQEIVQYYSNLELFKIFKNNKRILLFLIEEGMIKIDKIIFEEIMNSPYTKWNYLEYFSPEIKPYLEEMKQQPKIYEEHYEKILETYKEDIKIFNEKRKTGENESLICELIRNDSIDEFIKYVNRENYPINNYIDNSIYETNLFLLEREKTSLIEYSAFFGSVQIFRYLYLNNVELTESLWIYSIHGKCEEIIRILEEKKVVKNISYEKCFLESIKCHHIDVSNFIEQNFNSEKFKDPYFLLYSIFYYNFLYLPNEDQVQNSFLLFYACKYDYYTLVELLLTNKNIDIKTRFIQTLYIFIIVEFIFLIFNGRVIIMEFNIINTFDNKTFFQVAADNDNEDIINLLLSKVNEIFTECFSECKKMPKISIPSSVESIGNKAFYYCISLQNITIPSSVTYIGSSAFSDCTSLINVTIPSSVTYIGSSAFSGCKSLMSFDIPSNMSSIENGTFSGCSSLTKIVIPSSVKSIGENSFSKCKSLTNIEIPSNVIYIGYSAFSGCESLVSFEIPSNMSKIENGTFSGCSSLTKIVIPSSVKSIGENSFSKCKSLTNIEIPSNVIYIGYSAFSGCESLVSFEIPSNMSKIENGTFSGCSSLTKIVIPSSVKSIGEYSFSECYSLTNIEIPSNVTYIGSNSFCRCSSLTSFEISLVSNNELTYESIPTNNMFKLPQQLASNPKLEVEDKIDDVFSFENDIDRNDCTSLLSQVILFHGSLYEDQDFLIQYSQISSSYIPFIGSYAFFECSSLTDIIIPESVISIESFSFSGCSLLTSIKIPSNVKIIKSFAFYKCPILKRIEISSSLKSINSNVFSECPLLQNIELPPSLKHIGERAFFKCSSLQSIKIPLYVEEILEDTFSGCTSLTRITIPSNVISIKEHAFDGCSSLESIEIPQSVNSIGKNAFSRCSSLKIIKIPRKTKVQTIGICSQTKVIFF